jgi:hypothetical protein
MFQVSQNPFDDRVVNIMWIKHELSYLVYSKGNIVGLVIEKKS